MLVGVQYPNFSVYEVFFFPRIALLKISADMAFTSGTLGSPDWSLPPSCPQANRQMWLKPTRFLLGYHPAQKLTKSHFLTLKWAGFNPDMLLGLNDGFNYRDFNIEYVATLYIREVS